MTTYHELKTWPDVFEEMWKGNKRHEWRKNDRDYQLGDMLILREWEPRLVDDDEIVDGHYTGRRIFALVTFINKGPEWGIPEGFAVMSVEIVTKRAA